VDAVVIGVVPVGGDVGGEVGQVPVAHKFLP
jgi:hypothetical protein